MDLTPINGFSKLSKLEKIDLISKKIESNEDKDILKSFWHKDEKLQNKFDEFSENTITNFFFPYGIVPNFLVNNKNFCVPMVIEESSVVAALSKTSKYWFTRGGFKAEVVDIKKIGQIHFSFDGPKDQLVSIFNNAKKELIFKVKHLTKNMETRGGGLIDVELKDMCHEIENYYQLHLKFNTVDAMGANFVNTVIEHMAKDFSCIVNDELISEESSLTIIMSILSNYTPECLVRAWLECDINELEDPSINMTGMEFAKKMKWASDIAHADVYRATTHNKGIFNGIDAVVLATGNDFRAVEACGHAYAARSGKYSSLSKVIIDGNKFKMELEIPLALGTVGGLTSLHPLANYSLKLLNNPNSKELMEIVACSGLGQNFAAMKSLVTDGIQKGHMKMHLFNVLNHFDCTKDEREKCVIHFKEETVSFNSVREFLAHIRGYH